MANDAIVRGACLLLAFFCAAAGVCLVWSLCHCLATCSTCKGIWSSGSILFVMPLDVSLVLTLSCWLVSKENSCLLQNSRQYTEYGKYKLMYGYSMLCWCCFVCCSVTCSFYRCSSGSLGFFCLLWWKLCGLLDCRVSDEMSNWILLWILNLMCSVILLVQISWLKMLLTLAKFIDAD